MVVQGEIFSLHNIEYVGQKFVSVGQQNLVPGMKGVHRCGGSNPCSFPLRKLMLQNWLKMCSQLLIRSLASAGYFV